MVGVIARVRRDPELHEREQRLLGRYISPIPYPLTSFVRIPFESARRNIKWYLRASVNPSTPNRLYPIDLSPLLLHQQGFRRGILK